MTREPLTDQELAALADAVDIIAGEWPCRPGDSEGDTVETLEAVLTRHGWRRAASSPYHWLRA